MSCILMKKLETDLGYLSHKGLERVRSTICSEMCDGKCRKEYLEQIKVEKIEKVDKKTAAEIIYKRKPLGLFYTIEKSSGKNIYVGIDNSNGDAWTEDFKSLASCKRWLTGEYKREDKK